MREKLFCNFYFKIIKTGNKFFAINYSIIIIKIKLLVFLNKEKPFFPLQKKNPCFPNLRAGRKIHATNEWMTRVIYAVKWLASFT